MGLNLKYFNRIIDVYFLDDKGAIQKQILCPRKGIKPKIELVGKLLPSLSGGELPSFNLTITNLYLDFIDRNSNKALYPKIKITAGYANSAIQIVGTVVSMFQEEPGPDGKTVIICQNGNLNNWLDSYVDIDLEQGSSFSDVITSVSKGLGFTGTPIIPAAIKNVSLPGKFACNGTASYVLEQFFKLFPEKQLRVTEENNLLYIYCVGDEVAGTKTVDIEYLSSPPQKNVGGANGAYYTTFSAPWNPDVKPGVKVTFPAWAYTKYFKAVNTNNGKNAIIVQSVDIHFSTVDKINQMQVQGIGAKV